MTTRIIAPVPGLNGPGVGGLIFKDSVAETDNVAVIEYCTAAGYTVEPVEPERAYPEGEVSKAWKVDELRRWASDHKVTLGDAKTKEAILDAIANPSTPSITTPSEPPAGTPLTPEELAEVAAHEAMPDIPITPPES